MMRKLLFILLFTGTTLFAQVEGGIHVPYVDFPMKEGKGMYSTRGKCNMCHSWGYTLNQGLQSKKFWREKVMKMIVIFKAPIKTQKDIDTVVDYLFENYGNGELE
ncbi:MAG: sulfite:cytochrome C oxidoreductase subunit B [Campylobacterota bacterium]|nr:sulfite:cytochrome C oxidoreductase subunit B [Campylobacterota bacterium]